MAFDSLYRVCHARAAWERSPAADLHREAGCRVGFGDEAASCVCRGVPAGWKSRLQGGQATGTGQGCICRAFSRDHGRGSKAEGGSGGGSSNTCTVSLNAQAEVQSLKATPLKDSDPCTAYGANCTYCLAHEYCGWCSTDVIYADGQTGSQCAGFNPNDANSSAFVCNGRYSTFACTVGYDCDKNTSQCVVDPIAGNGFPLSECEQLCRPTPPPTPPQDMYICNITTKQCYKCNETFCPGAMPQATCAAACVKPKPGPTGLVVGLWRGLQIQNSYPLTEYEWLFNASALTVYKQGQEQWSATITSYGGDVMQFDVVSGTASGSKFSAIYSVQNQGGPLYSIMTLAVGSKNGNVPQSFATPMETAGEIELVLAKCVSSPCKFNNP